MKIENNNIRIEVNSHGAELTSLKKNDTEYLWQGDATYWGRHAPILFPIVGKVWNGTYRVEGKEYHLPQHGFARDMDFATIAEGPDYLELALESCDETQSVYPYDFRLGVRYSLKENSLCCRWTVRNTGKKKMFYQIGAHPAFNYRNFDPKDTIHGMMAFLNESLSTAKPVMRGCIGEGGCRTEMAQQKVPMILPLTDKLFEHDALLLEDGKTRHVVLRDKGAKEYLRLSCNAEVFGIWSPAGKKAPFVCIEPWMGRCDRVGFEGDISERDFIQSLEPDEERDFVYTIEVI